MTTDCRRVDEWLDEMPEPTAPPAALEAHAAECDECRGRLDFERLLRDRLGAGAELDAAHRAVLVAKITAAAGVKRRPMRLLRWSWLPLAAAAAVTLAIVYWPVHREPIPPSDIFGDLIGPLATMTPVSAPAAKAEEESPLTLALAALWGDFDGPLAIGRAAIEAPRAAAGLDRKPLEPKSVKD